MNGTLTINLDPPYMQFQHTATGSFRMRYCSLEEIEAILNELGASCWPLKECFVRVEGPFLPSSLAQADLLPLPQVHDLDATATAA